jgi:hypothetical protein
LILNKQGKKFNENRIVFFGFFIERKLIVSGSGVAFFFSFGSKNRAVVMDLSVDE